MYYPTYYVENFFDNPDEIVNWAKTLTYNKDTNGLWPGKRSQMLHEINVNFVNAYCYKLFHLIYGRDISQVEWDLNCQFQLINYEDISAENNQGWIHRDPKSTLTVITYLTNGTNKSGTTIYKPNKLGLGVGGDLKCKPLRNDYYKHNKKSNNYEEEITKFNNNFTPVAKFYSNYNSTVAFDGGHYHGANWDLKPGEERLTLISFFNEIKAPYIPIGEMKRQPN
jgi:hypothetical protein